MIKPSVKYQWIDSGTYQQIWDMQSRIHKELIDSKRDIYKEDDYHPLHHLLLCEHNHVYTLGKSGSDSNLLIDEKSRNEQNIEYFKINRGGDITYHGKGQITGYPILDLDDFFNDVHRYVRSIEETIILTLSDYGLEGIRLIGYTGVWLPPKDDSDFFRKICAIGVHLSRWVSMHGFAFNVNTDLSYFDKIIPCGILDKDKKVTSLAAELGKEIPMKEVASQYKIHFQEVFSCQIIE